MLDLASISSHLFIAQFSGREKYLRGPILNSRAGGPCEEILHGAEWLAIKRRCCDWFGVSTSERDRCKGAFFCLRSWESLCAFGRACSHVGASGRVHDLFLFSGTAQTPHLACFSWIHPLPSPSSHLPCQFGRAPSRFPPLFFALYLLSTHHCVVAQFTRRPLSGLPLLRCTSTLAPWPEEGQRAPLNHCHLTLSSVAHLTGANHFSATADPPHAGLIFKSLFIRSDSSGTESH